MVDVVGSLIQYNGNAAYTEFNGVNCSANWTGVVGLSPTNATVDVTAGANATDVQRNAGLNDTKITLNLAYSTEATNRAAILLAFAPGTKAILVYAPEGLVSGKPVHEQMFLVQAPTGPNAAQKKDAALMLEVSLEGADAPIRKIWEDTV